MCEKLSKFWSDLDVTVKVNKRELVLGTAACTLAGLVLGMLCSPRKEVAVGSYNDNSNFIEKGCCDCAEEDAAAQ